MKNTSETVKCEHTPTPWRVVTADDYTGQAIEIAPPSELFNRPLGHGIICQMEWDDTEPFESDLHDQAKVDAQFIVTACNAHDVLLDAAINAEKLLTYHWAKPEQEILDALRRAISLATTT